jgi:hypothetical protein
MRWSQTSVLRKIVLVVAGVLIALEIALLLFGRFSPPVVGAVLILVYVNYFLWRRDQVRLRAPATNVDVQSSDS